LNIITADSLNKDAICYPKEMNRMLMPFLSLLVQKNHNNSNVPLTHFMLFVFFKRTVLKDIEQNQQPIFGLLMLFIFILVLFTLPCKGVK